MHARVTITEGKPDKVDESISIIQDSIAPAAKQQKGFKGLATLIDRTTSKGITISLWETEADMLAGEASGYLKEQYAKAMPTLAGPPTTEHYEVAVMVHE